jgi:hypothetical protein
MTATLDDLPDDWPHRETTTYLDDDGWRHTDADYLRRYYSMPRFDPDGFADYSPAPALFNHTWSGGADRVSGGPGCFIHGPEGTGKSTLFLRISEIEMDQNNARVVWRAVTGSRSEWLPFAPVARVCIPEGYDVTARFVPKERSRGTMGTEVPLEDVVREVVTYRDVMDLNLRVLQDGMFNVVYPDPQLRGCQWVYEESDRVVADSREEISFDQDDPTNHWWFGWGLSLVERGPFPWTAWMCDEVQSLAPEGAANDKYQTRLKIKMLGEAMEDFRKNGIARYFAGHLDKHMHSLWRDRILFRICMSRTKNPVSSNQSSIPVGFETVPMNHDLMSEAKIGEGLIYSQTRFDYVSWPEIPKPINGDLKVYLEPNGEEGAEGAPGVSA